MLEEELSVNNMKIHMETDVVFVTALEQKLSIHRHVSTTKKNGENINLTIVVQVWQGQKNAAKAQ